MSASMGPKTSVIGWQAEERTCQDEPLNSTFQRVLRMICGGFVVTTETNVKVGQGSSAYLDLRS